MNPIKKFPIKLMLFVASVLMISTITAQEKISPKLRLSYTKHMDGAYEIKSRAYTKKGKDIEPCAGASIGFYSDAGHQKLFKKLSTDEKGQAVLLLNGQEVNTFKDSAGHYNFYGRVEEDSKFNSEEADISVMDAAIDVNFKQEGDSVKSIKASIMCYDQASGKMIPGVKVPLKFFVKRSLCLLPVGKDLNYTDEQGNAEVTFPNDIPGDKDGNLTVIVKLDEDDNYGTVQYEKVMKWGIPLLNPENPVANRSLIGARNNAPWFMVIIINAMLIGIWGYLLYIVFSLFRIKKLGKTNT